MYETILKKCLKISLKKVPSLIYLLTVNLIFIIFFFTTVVLLFFKVEFIIAKNFSVLVLFSWDLFILWLFSWKISATFLLMRWEIIVFEELMANWAFYIVVTIFIPFNVIYKTLEFGYWRKRKWTQTENAHQRKMTTNGKCPPTENAHQRKMLTNGKWPPLVTGGKCSHLLSFDWQYAQGCVH